MSIKNIVKNVDPFRDGSGIALYCLDNNASDEGGSYNGSWSGQEQYTTGVFGQCANFNGNSQISCGSVNQIYDEIWISFWMNWDGSSSVMPIGFEAYDIWMNYNYFGWNTANGDIYGIDFSSSVYANKWIFIVLNFKTKSYGDSLYINKLKQTLSQKRGSMASQNAIIKNSTFHISGWGRNTGYKINGLIDQVRIFNRPLTDEEINFLYYEKMPQTLFNRSNVS